MCEVEYEKRERSRKQLPRLHRVNESVAESRGRFSPRFAKMRLIRKNASRRNSGGPISITAWKSRLVYLLNHSSLDPKTRRCVSYSIPIIHEPTAVLGSPCREVQNFPEDPRHVKHIVDVISRQIPGV